MSTQPTVARLGLADEADFTAAVRASRDLHHPWVDPPDTPERFAAYLDGGGPDSHVTYGLRCGDCGQLAGWSRVANIVRRAFCSAALSYGAFAGHAGRGLMTAGLEGVLADVFGPLGLHRVEANIQPDNLRSIALARRLGFELEGRSPAFLMVGGEWRDHERWTLRAETFSSDRVPVVTWRPDLPVRTDRLLLRSYVPSDADALLAIYGRADVTRFLYFETMDPPAARALLGRRVHQDGVRGEGDQLALAVELPGVGVIGDLSFFWTSAADRQGEIGFSFHPDHQGHGYATEAAAAIMDLGLRDRAAGGLGLHRIRGSCDARNTASAAVMRRLGMREEAHLVGHQRFKGEWDEELVFAVRAEEWAAR